MQISEEELNELEESFKNYQIKCIKEGVVDVDMAIELASSVLPLVKSLREEREERLKIQELEKALQLFSINTETAAKLIADGLKGVR